jgi:hypothetical protein
MAGDEGLFWVESNNLLWRTLVRNAHIAAVQLAPGPQQAIDGSVGCPGPSECRLRRKLTLICAAQQSIVDPLTSIRRRPVIGRSVTIADLCSRIRFFRAATSGPCGGCPQMAASCTLLPVALTAQTAATHSGHPSTSHLIVPRNPIQLTKLVEDNHGEYRRALHYKGER